MPDCSQQHAHLNMSVGSSRWLCPKGLRQQAHPECAARLLDDVDGFQIGTAFEAQHGVHCQLGEVVFIMRQDL